MIHVYYAPWFQLQNWFKDRLWGKFSEINLKVNYVDKQDSGKYSIT